MIIFTDRCLAQISEGIAVFEPEAGGALLKLPISNIVCEFLPDPAEMGLTGAVVGFSLGLYGAFAVDRGGFGMPRGRGPRCHSVCCSFNPLLQRLGGRFR